MNTALELCSGRLVWFVNAGDEIAPGDTVASIRNAVAKSDPLWLIGQVAFVDATGRTTVPDPFDFAEERRHLFARGRFAPHQGTLTRTDWLRTNGGYRPGYVVAADYEASLRLSQAQAPLTLESVIAVFHVGGVSATRWRTSVAEFHRARRDVLRPAGTLALREWAWTGASFTREAAGSLLRRWRPPS